MTARGALFSLLLVVAVAAAVLSFAALRDLARMCGFAVWLAWLLPVVVDAGAAAGSLVWLGGWAADTARRFARALALCLLALSVAANALGHGLEAYGLEPPWWVVVVVSAIAPAVLGAVVHLAVLVGRVKPAPPVELADDDFADLGDEPLSPWWESAPPVSEPSRYDRAEALIASGIGRRRLARELGVTEHEARQLLASSRRDDAADDPEENAS
ncbi:DUF2637 domain-containing protein [Pseudonocardia sp. NPDC049154]|uniref:DUF2637 domain-containing protein n=1 Tax=Pseudonocardia sp. NPDC049154 TaxID=3155501 RepID=UPI00340E90E1